MTDMSTTDPEVSDRLAALEERVAALEQHRPAGAEVRPGGEHPDRPVWIVDGIRQQQERGDLRGGAVYLAGSLTLPGGGGVEWQQGAHADDLFGADWDPAVQQLAALAHPVRLTILHHLLSGHETTAELTELESIGTTGQLHHHLRPLLAAGWVVQQGRGRYAVPAARVVPLLATLEANLL